MFVRVPLALHVLERYNKTVLPFYLYIINFFLFCLFLAGHALFNVLKANLVLLLTSPSVPLYVSPSFPGSRILSSTSSCAIFVLASILGIFYEGCRLVCVNIQSFTCHPQTQGVQALIIFAN